MAKNINPAQEALSIIEKLKETHFPEIGNYEQAELYIKTTGNVSPQFLQSLKEKLVEVKQWEKQSQK